MARSEEVILTNMCMIENDKGEVVMQIRSPERYSWDGAAYPGGHIELGESLHEAVVREVYEETGLTIKNPRLVGVKHFHTRGESIRYLVFLYKATEFEGNIRSSDEGEIKWVPKTDFKTIDLADSMDDIIQFYEEENTSELFYLRDVNDILQRQFL
ncbi:8-oxo-dGTP diphosphatase [Streptococcus hillyeri]|uniref:8-oxo-dGTP diphosphatase n=1 Tax=Streptococcus hillyeri TaxID=2282420 RepID=A0A3L9DLX9_9STRE|nr:8-oxo-dGTP diphosphatase [Streptococcus hillyeri]RLY01178.1 8-oxo-dGTP diphosphatase [Streptococcus hillyeri]